MLDQGQEVGVVTLHAERVGETERHSPSGRVRQLRRVTERRLRVGLVEQVPLEVRDRRPSHQGLGDVGHPSSDAAPRKVLRVRSASGVTRIKHRPVG